MPGPHWFSHEVLANGAQQLRGDVLWDGRGMVARCTATGRFGCGAMLTLTLTLTLKLTLTAGTPLLRKNWEVTQQTPGRTSSLRGSSGGRCAVRTRVVRRDVRAVDRFGGRGSCCLSLRGFVTDTHGRAMLTTTTATTTTTTTTTTRVIDTGRRRARSTVDCGRRFRGLHQCKRLAHGSDGLREGGREPCFFTLFVTFHRR